LEFSCGRFCAAVTDGAKYRVTKFREFYDRGRARRPKGFGDNRQQVFGYGVATLDDIDGFFSRLVCEGGGSASIFVMVSINL
jgi:hypothetical protein